MYFTQRIGRQLGGGFGLVLAITLSVVAFGCFAMWRALDNAHEMKDRDLPAAAAAKAIELNVLQTMYAIRSWTYTNEKRLLDNGRDHLAKLRNDILPAAADLARREHLPILEKAVATADKDVARYADLLDQTERAFANHNRLVQVRLDTAEAALKEAIEVKKAQLGSLQEEIVTDKGDKETRRRVARIDQVTTIIEHLYGIRVAVLLAQSSRDVSRIAEVSRMFATIAGQVTEMLGDTRRQDNKDRLNRMSTALDLYHRAVKEWAHDIEALARLGAERQVVAEEALAAAATAAQANLDKTTAAADSTARQMTTSTTVLFAGLFAALAAGSLLAWLLARSISTPVRETSAALARLADGDFRTGLATRRQDELGDMARSVDATVQALRTALGTIRQTAQRVGGHATAIAGAADQVAASSEETTHQVTTVATSTEEISTSMNTVSAATQEMSSSIDHISQHANEVTGMAGDANARAQTAAKEMETLQGASERISGAVKLIARIAEQTNLLALNAAIEAASAGEAGRGFAVVASEVKALAQQTSDATRQIGEMVQDIQTSAATSQQTIGTFLELVQKITQLQQSVAAAVEQQTATTKEITSNVQEAATGVRLITENMTGVQTSAETSTAAATAARQAVKELQGASDELDRIVRRFKLE